MAKLEKPVRMCIVCRQRFGKTELLRLQCKNKKLVQFCGDGRSFYICYGCIDTGLKNNETQSKNNVFEKKIEKALFRECKNKDEYIFQLKEILTDVR